MARHERPTVILPTTPSRNITKTLTHMPLDIFVNNILPLLTMREVFNLLLTCKALYRQFSSAFVYIGAGVTTLSRTSQDPQDSQIEMADAIDAYYANRISHMVRDKHWRDQYLAAKGVGGEKWYLFARDHLALEMGITIPEIVAIVDDILIYT
ncbi:hypothetical protein K440DRAFT_638130 [Wilcoxina mikolae CBS 423.85]|nr:hypothetical protein K440DRAFT_638130 [Wilcoxina mikolae CBS 423.85]